MAELEFKFASEPSAEIDQVDALIEKFAGGSTKRNKRKPSVGWVSITVFIPVYKS